MQQQHLGLGLTAFGGVGYPNLVSLSFASPLVVVVVAVANFSPVSPQPNSSKTPSPPYQTTTNSKVPISSHSAPPHVGPP